MTKSIVHYLNDDGSRVIKSIQDNLEEDTKYRIPEKLNHTYTYDEIGNITKSKTVDSKDSIIQLSSFEYDELNRTSKAIYEVVPIRFRKSKPNMTYDSIAYNVEENIKTTFNRKPNKTRYTIKTKPIIAEVLRPDPGTNKLVVKRQRKKSETTSYYEFDKYNQIIRADTYMTFEGIERKSSTIWKEIIYIKK